MTVQEILKELEKLGDANTKKVLMTHGAKEPFFGVKVADLKNILKKTKKSPLRKPVLKNMTPITLI